MATAMRRATWGPDVPPDGWSESLVLYAAAVHQMRQLSPRIEELGTLAKQYVWPRRRELREPGQTMATSIISAWTDPRGLGYQAQVHATFMDPGHWPTIGGHRALWSRCAHGNWFFLPWHRAYLLEFEAVARQHLRDVGVPDADADRWGLPYWNSSDYASIAGAAGIPMAARAATLPDDLEVPGIAPGPDRPNPLFDATRSMTGAAPANHPDPMIGAASAQYFADASDALSRHHYATREDSRSVSFGGGYLETMSLVHGSGEPGQLDGQPHGLVHSFVGGNMGRFETAGLDPLFWMHHANIDRLWETYAQDLGHRYPFVDGVPAGDAKDSWDRERFPFLRGDRTLVEWSATQVVSVTTLGYAYETTDPPTIFPVATDPPGQDDDPFGLALDAPVAIAAAAQVEVTGSTTIALAGGAPGGVGRTIGAGQTWTLRFIGIRCELPATTGYRVLLGPAGREQAVGTLSLFGAFEATVAGGTGSGMTRVIEVTEPVADRRAEAGGFDVFDARVTLEPMTDDGDLAGVGLQIGQVALYVG